MTVVKELFTRMGFQVDFAKLAQFDKGVATANRKVDDLRNSVGKRLSLMVGTENLNRAMVAAAKFKQSVLALKSSVANGIKLQIDASKADSASSKIKSLVGDLKGLAVAYLGFQGVARAGSFIAQAGMEFEKLSASLTTVEGSTQGAAKAFAKIEKFAKDSPYELSEVADAYIKLKNLGLDPSERALKAYGNTAGAMGKPLNQLIEAVADASTGEFERLKEFGIKSKKQGENVTFTFKGAATTVKNNATEIQKYLMRIGEVDFAGGMDRQSKTIGGQISTMKDNFGALAREVWKGGLGIAAHQFVKWLTEVTEKAKPFLTQLGNKIPHALQKARELLPLVAGGLALVTLRMVGMKAIMVGGWILNAVKAMRALTWASALANAAAFAIPFAIGAVVAAVAYLGYEIYKFATTGKGWIADLGKQWPEFGNLANQARELFLQWMPTLINVYEVIKILVMDGIIWLGKKTLEVVQYWILPAIVTMANMWQQFWEGFEIIKQMILMAYEDWKTGIAIVGDAWKTWGQNVTNTINYVKEIFVTFFNYLADKFSWVTNAAGSVANAFSSMGNALGMGGGDMSAGITENMGARARVARTAINFVQTGAAQKHAMLAATKAIVELGGSCGYTVDHLLKLSGVTKDVSKIISNPNYVPNWKNLAQKGLAVRVPASQAMAGDIVTNAGESHIGLATGNGKVVHAAGGRNSAVRGPGGVKQLGTVDNLTAVFGSDAIVWRLKDSMFSESKSGLGSARLPKVERTFQMPAASMGGGSSSTMNNNVSSPIVVNVGGSNASASQIANETGKAVNQVLQSGLAAVYRSVPAKVAPR